MSAKYIEATVQFPERTVKVIIPDIPELAPHPDRIAIFRRLLLSRILSDAPSRTIAKQGERNDAIANALASLLGLITGFSSDYYLTSASNIAKALIVTGAADDDHATVLNWLNTKAEQV